MPDLMKLITECALKFAREPTSECYVFRLFLDPLATLAFLDTSDSYHMAKFKVPI